MMNDANDAVKLIHAFAAKVGQGHSAITYDPIQFKWTIRFGMRIRGKSYSWDWSITAGDLSCNRDPVLWGENLAEKLRREIRAETETDPSGQGKSYAEECRHSSGRE